MTIDLCEPLDFALLARNILRGPHVLLYEPQGRLEDEPLKQPQAQAFHDVPRQTQVPP